MDCYFNFSRRIEDELYFDSPPLLLSQSKLFLEPLGNGRVVYVQEEAAFLVSYYLCRDVIGKRIAPVLIGMQPPAIIDGLPM